MDLSLLARRCSLYQLLEAVPMPETAAVFFLSRLCNSSCTPNNSFLPW